MALLAGPGFTPPMVISPAVGVSSPIEHLISVDLPAPFGPSRPTSLPGSIEKLTSRSATRPP